MPPAIKNNWRDIGVVLTVASATVTVVFFVAPLKTLPNDVKQVRDTQIAQTEILRTLTETANETKQLRRDVDKNTSSIQNLKEEVRRYHP